MNGINRKIIKVGIYLGFVAGLLLIAVRIVAKLPLIIMDKIKLSYK